MNNADFERLLLPHRAALERFVFWRITNATEAEDILQNTCLLAYQKRDDLHATDAFKPWLLQIARNLCNAYYRKNAAQNVIPLEEVEVADPRASRFELRLMVRDTLERLPQNSGEILDLTYFGDLPQAQIAQQLNVPLGTVKSRLHTAKRQFRDAYEPKGETIMMLELPAILPDYRVNQIDKPVFAVQLQEAFECIVPKVGATALVGEYDMPSRALSFSERRECVGKATVHGLEGVEIVGSDWKDSTGLLDTSRSWVIQQTETHTRTLSTTRFAPGEKKTLTFLDGDEFMDTWGCGKDDCGESHYPKAKGRYEIEINGNIFDTIRMEEENGGILHERYVDQSGRTVLQRQFVRDDWTADWAQKTALLWSEQLPGSEQRVVDGVIFVHWYDVVTDYLYFLMPNSPVI